MSSARETARRLLEDAITEAIQRAIEDAVAEEREACAAQVEEMCGRVRADSSGLYLAAAIRARGKEEEGDGR